jgi:hypothetical protein
MIVRLELDRFALEKRPCHGAVLSLESEAVSERWMERNPHRAGGECRGKISAPLETVAYRRVAGGMLRSKPKCAECRDGVSAGARAWNMP